MSALPSRMCAFSKKRWDDTLSALREYQGEADRVANICAYTVLHPLHKTRTLHLVATNKGAHA